MLMLLHHIRGEDAREDDDNSNGVALRGKVYL